MDRGRHRRSHIGIKIYPLTGRPEGHPRQVAGPESLAEPAAMRPPAYRVSPTCQECFKPPHCGHAKVAPRGAPECRRSASTMAAISALQQTSICGLRKRDSRMSRRCLKDFRPYRLRIGRLLAAEDGVGTKAGRVTLSRSALYALVRSSSTVTAELKTGAER